MNCYHCRGLVVGRAEHEDNAMDARWGSWCPRCHAWWPDEPDGTHPDTDRPAPYLLVDKPFSITPRGRPHGGGRSNFW